MEIIRPFPISHKLRMHEIGNPIRSRKGSRKVGSRNFDIKESSVYK